MSNRAIGERLFISTNTAANHVRNILIKTGAANRTQAAMYAADHELRLTPRQMSDSAPSGIRRSLTSTTALAGRPARAAADLMASGDGAS